jgi:hypothetical protein
MWVVKEKRGRERFALAADKDEFAGRLLHGEQKQP